MEYVENDGKTSLCGIVPNDDQTQFRFVCDDVWHTVSQDGLYRCALLTHADMLERCFPHWPACHMSRDWLK
jgi:hypothetical protein